MLPSVCNLAPVGYRFTVSSQLPVSWKFLTGSKHDISKKPKKHFILSEKKVLLKISQNSHENKCATVSFLMNLQA